MITAKSRIARQDILSRKKYEIGSLSNINLLIINNKKDYKT